MSNSHDVRRALEKRLDAGVYTGIASNQIVWENLTVDPSGFSLWLEPKFTVSNMSPAVIGAGNAVRWDGLFRIDCYGESNNATFDVENLADEVLAQFPYGLQITENSKIINIQFSERRALMKYDPWIMCPVIMSWYSYIS